MTKAVIYLRSSTKQHDLASQRAKCLAYAEQHGYSIVGEYVDAGEPGNGKHQDSLDVLLGDATDGLFEAVVTTSKDRLTRRPESLRSLGQSGIRIETFC